MSIYLISLIVGSVGFLVTLLFDMYAKSYHDASFLMFASLVLSFVGLLSSLFLPVQTNYYLVACSVAQTQKTISVVTDYGVFSSDKKEDFDNWTGLTSGYLQVSYNSFGAEIAYKTFTKNNNKIQ